MSKAPTLTTRFLNDTETKQTPWAIIADIKKKDAAAEVLYTQAEKDRAAELLAQAREVFIRSRCFLNYRDSFIVIKVEKVQSSDKLSAGFDAFELAMAELGAENDHKNGHYLFHIFPR